MVQVLPGGEVLHGSHGVAVQAGRDREPIVSEGQRLCPGERGGLSFAEQGFSTGQGPGATPT